MRGTPFSGIIERALCVPHKPKWDDSVARAAGRERDAAVTTPLHERLYRTEAIVLRRSEIGEADYILTVTRRTWAKSG